jgi:drug/metabolite transporter (DMT)-like permease
MGLAIGLAGLAVLFNPLGFDWSDGDVVVGNGLLLLAALLWSGCILFMRTRSYNLTTLQLAPWQLLVATATILVSALLFEPDRSIDWTPDNITLIAVIGPIGTSVTFWALTTTMRYLPAITSSIGFLGVPVAITIAATFLFGETLTWTHISGLVVITVGIALVTIAQARESG